MAGFLPQRQLVLVDLLSLILSVRPGERAIVAVDGAPDAGTTRLVGEVLALAQQVAGRELVGVSIDGFHLPRTDRPAAGSGEEGHYHGSFDYASFRRCVVEPFRAGREIVPAVHDVATDQPVHPDPIEAAEDAIVVVEGIFLRRPELAGLWDASVLVLAAHHQSPVAGYQRYVQQARIHPPTWILDTTDQHRPHLLEPDPEEPLWFDA